MDETNFGEFIIDFLTVLDAVGKHVLEFQRAMEEGRYREARARFLKARTETIRFKLDPRTSRVIRMALNELRAEMYQTIAKHGARGAYHLAIGR